MKILYLTVEDICSVVEKIDVNGRIINSQVHLLYILHVGFNDEEMDSRPADTYILRGGGRMPSPVTRKVNVGINFLNYWLI